MARAVIVSAVRTPFGRLGGGLRDYEATELGALAIRAALDRVGLGNEEIDYVIMGQVLQGGAGQAPGRQAAVVSRELGISREDQDRWALRSHERAAAAQDSGFLDEEIVPVGDVRDDESIRRDTSYERLAALKPVMDPEGTTTAGNAPGVNDGASCVIVTSEEFARRRGLEPLATIVAQGYVADEFAYLARTPARAGAIALE